MRKTGQHASVAVTESNLAHRKRRKFVFGEFHLNETPGLFRKVSKASPLHFDLQGLGMQH